jgi:hypothetical protein
MRYAASALVTCGLLIGAGGAAAEAVEPIGEAVQVVNLVTAELKRDTRSLRSGDEVRQDEIIEVGSDGAGELVLNDDTKIALGPGSRLVLDKFVYDSDRKGSILINLVKGTLRFVTGLAEKPAYVIRVPSASITVRGTIFDLFVEQSGSSWLLLQDGGVRVCTDGGTCRDHNEPGKLIQITAAAIGAPTRWSSLPGAERISFDSAFPFVVEPPSIDRKPKFSRDQIIGALAKPESPPARETKEPEPKPRKKDRDQEKAKKKKDSEEAKKKDDDDDDDDDRRSSKQDGKKQDGKKKSLFERLRENDNDGGRKSSDRGGKGRRADRD